MKPKLPFFVSILFAALAVSADAQYRGAVLAPKPIDQLVQDITDLAARGANLGRYQIHVADDANARIPANYVAEVRAQARNIRESLLPVCRNLNFKLVVDLHEGPGDYFGGYPERGTSGYIRSKTHEKTLRNAWKAIWSELSQSPYQSNLYGLDLYNEPLVLANERRDDGEYDRFHARHVSVTQSLVNDLRSQGCRANLIVENVNVNPQRMTLMPKLRDSLNRIIYSVHMYEPIGFSHGKLDPLSNGDRLYSYPGSVGSGRRAVVWDKDRILDFLSVVRNWQRRNNVKIYVGEFSAMINAGAPGPDFTVGDGSGEEWLADVISVFERYRWDWTYHAWREAGCWNAEALEPRINLLAAAWAKNRTP